MTAGLDARLRYPLDQLLIIVSYVDSAQRKVNLWHRGVDARGRLNEVTVILLGAEVGSHANDQRTFRDLQLPAEGQPRGRIRAELVQIETIGDDRHSSGRVA
jgi:hypothetical protein